MKNHMKQLRQDKGLSQEKMAEIFKVSRQTIISIEHGHYNPSLPFAIQIARFFDKIVEEVFILEEK
ncbi:MAG TPA: helix-turn-helix transcriptional regulator [Desulfosporosinus sp.]|nr:helix-turn-helix transcriptional regulator [Desulfosporosinus sp.]